MIAVVLFVPIVGGLVLSGQRLIVADQEVLLAQSAATEWLADEAPQLRLDRVTVDARLVVLEATGPVLDLPSVEPLASEVSAAVGRALDVRVEITPRVILESGVDRRQPSAAPSS